MMRLSVSDRLGARPGPGAVLGHVGDAGLDGLEDRPVGDVPAVHEDVAGAGSQPGDDLGQLALAVAGHAGQGEDLARADLEVDIRQGSAGRGR